MKSKVAVLSAAVLFAGCAPKLPAETFLIDDAVLAKRQNEMKNVSREYETLLSDSVAALQDMGFDIKKADDKIGYIHASKMRELTSGFQAGMAEFGANFTMALLGVQGNYRHPQKVNVNAYLLVSPKGDSCHMRTTFFNTEYDKHSVPLSYRSVEDQEIYQGFYNKIGTSSFLEDHLND